MPATLEQPALSQATTPEPVPITGHDIKRIAPCAATTPTRYAINRIEIGPLGLTATDGRILCVLNRPGSTQRLYVNSKQAKAVPKESRLKINGQVEFVTEGRHSTMRATLEHVGPDEARFPELARMLPDAGSLVPVGTFDIALLKKLLTALQGDGSATVSVYGRSDTRLAPFLLVNPAGDLGLIMPLANGKGQVAGDFPKAIYEALGKATRTADHAR